MGKQGMEISWSSTCLGCSEENKMFCSGKESFKELLLIPPLGFLGSEVIQNCYCPSQFVTWLCNSCADLV